MPPLKTPICDFGTNAKDFKLNSTNNNLISLNDIRGDTGTLIVFICNHCPYVKAVIKDIIEDCKNLEKLGVKAVTISSNDPINYPEDSFENMIKFAKEHQFNFPYLFDDTQKVAKSYDAVCTPDFFGYNHNLELQYRGRIRELENLKPVRTGYSDLFNAMKQIVETGRGPKEQAPSLGCSIKWLDNQCI
ncbi:thioredoxin family protein [Candidatus Pelagibacter sp.]|nr:thioredoxin family protein [Candidatus Pelagibacter sp.]